MQRHYVENLMLLEQQNLHIYYLDETSISLWVRQNKSWTGLEEPVVLPLQPTRGKSRTIIGAFCNWRQPHVITQVCDRTNSVNVISFLRKLIAYQRERNINLRHVVVITDNHPCHKSELTQTFLVNSGLRMLYLPKYSCVLSPIERFWAMLKN